MYSLIITFGLCLTYFVLFYFLPLLFEKKITPVSKKALFSIILIAVLSLLCHFFISKFLNLEFGLGNRLLHGLGGGFLAFLVCFLVVKDSQISFSKFQFFIISALIVTTLGVANEIIEFLLQIIFDFKMAESIIDTWLDLVSNSVGLLIAGLLFVPFISSRKIDQTILK